MKLEIFGKTKLSGDIYISGSKNASLPIICSTLLTNCTYLTNVPEITDIYNLLKIFYKLGISYTFNNNRLHIKNNFISYKDINFIEATKFRASYYLIGVFLSLFNKVSIAYPGGCNLGDRSIDIHLDVFKQLGYKINDNNEYLVIEGKPVYKDIVLKNKSFGATINAILSTVKTDREIKIFNYLLEPEILDTVKYLINSGYRIQIKKDYIIVKPSTDIESEITYNIMPDRMETGTYMILGSLFGNINIYNCRPRDLRELLTVLNKCGVDFYTGIDFIEIKNKTIYKPEYITTDIYPGFPTDLQQLYTIFISLQKGRSFIKENIFPERTNHVKELVKLNANLKIYRQYIISEGNSKLKGTIVDSVDLRGTASLIIAGLIAKGKTTINNIDVIFRGYENIVNKLKNIGANINLIE